MKNTRLLVALAAATSTLKGASLLHYYDFESDFNDPTGGANGTAGAEVSSSLGGGFDGGNAVSFPGSLSGGGPYGPAGYVALSPTIPSLTGPVAFSYWVRLNSDPLTNARGIFDFSGDGGDGPQSLYIQSGAQAGRLAFRVDGAGTSNLVAFSDVPEDGSWFSVIANFDPAGQLEVYINGTLQGTASGAFTSAPWSADQYLGAFNVNGIAAPRGVDGDLDDFAVYEGLLSSAEIAGLSSGTLSPTSIPEPSSALLALLGLGLLRRKRS